MGASIPASRARAATAVRGWMPGRPRTTIPTISATIAIAVGATVLAGWWLANDTLKSVVPGLLTMKVNTAIALILLGTGMLLRARGSRAAVVPLLAAVALSGLVGSQYLIGRDLGVDQWLFRELPGQVGTFQPNRMSPITIVCFMLLGTGVLLAGRRSAWRLAPAFPLTALIIGYFSLLDLTFEPGMPTLLIGYTQMALLTAVTVVVASIGGLSLLPGAGPFAAFLGPSAPARLARRLLAASIVVPAFLTWLWLRGQDAGFYGPQYGSSLVVLGTVAFLVAVIHQAARSAQRSEVARERILEERDRFFDVSIDMLATADANGYFIRLNPAWTTTLGYPLEELRAHPFIEFVHPDDRDATNAEAARQIDAGETVLNFQNRYRHRDGTYRWLEWTSTPSADGTRLYAMARDITARKTEEARLAAMLAPAREAQHRRHQTHERIEDQIAKRAFAPVFQPIVDLSNRAIVGFEALTRFHDGHRPDETFAAALDCGLGIELETVTIAAALERARLLPAGAWLSLNVSPALIALGGVLGPALAPRRRSVVLEITEHEAVTEYGPLREAVRELGPDIRLAVDDAGAGVANFNHLVELRPDFLKIDAGLVRAVNDDVGRQAVVAGLVHFAASAGCQVIAEGIETEAELATVVGLGVTLGQGYLLARPASAESWQGPLDELSPPVPLRVDRRRRAAVREVEPEGSLDGAAG